MDENDAVAKGSTQPAPLPAADEWRALTNLVPGIVWAAPAQGPADFFNDWWYEFTGMPRAPAAGDPGAGNPAADPVHPEDRARVSQAWEAARRDGADYRVELRLRSAHGRYHWFLVRARPLRDASGRIQRWFGLGTDISEHKEAEQRARFLERVSALLAEGTDAAALLAGVLEAIGAHLEVERVAFAEPSRDLQALVVEHEHARGAPSARGTHPWASLAAPAARQALARGEAVAIDDVRRHPWTEGQADYLAGLSVAAFAAVPLRADGRLRGVLWADSPRPRAWRPAEIELLADVGARLFAWVDRLRAVEALRRSERLYRRLAEADLFGVGFGDSTGRVFYVNDEMLRMMGRSREDFEAGRIDWLEAIAPEHRATIAREAELLLREGRRSGYEAAFLRPDGGRTPYVAGAALVTPGEDFHVSIALDLTQVRRAEARARAGAERLAEANRRLEESFALLDTLFDRAPIGLTFLDTEFRYVRINATLAALNGLPVEAHIGRAVEQVLPEVWPAVRPLLERVRDTGEPIANRLVHAPVPGRRDRDERGDRGDTWWLAGYYPVRVRGRLIGFGIAAIDVTDQKRAEAALLAADRRKDDFLATLAHELRNPLAPITNAVAILRASARDPALRPIVSIVERQVGHMVRLIDDLLDVSRIGRDKIELRRERLDLSAAVTAAVETSSPLLARKAQALRLALCAEPLPLEGDRVRLAQVVANLLNNASKYTPPGGHVELATRREGAEAVLCVSDDGVGLAPEHLSTVFQMFAQVDASDSVSEGGLGIGLWLVQRLVSLHGGRVQAFSEGEGRGSRFVVRLPLAGDAKA